MQYFFQLVDQFGIEEKVLFSRSKQFQKSIYGGVMTLILYGACLGYFLFQLIDWQENNKLPKMTTTSKQIDNLEKVTNKDVIAEIWYTSQTTNQIDPFDPKHLIYYPIFKSIPINESQIFKFEQINLDDGKSVNKFVFENIEIIGSPFSFTQWNMSDYQLQFERCNPYFIKEDMECANQSLYEKYIEQNNLVSIQIYIKQFNIKTMKLEKIPKIYQANLMIGQVLIYEIQFEVNSIIVDDGILFPNSNKQQFFSNFYQIKHVFEENYTMKHFGRNPILMIYFTMDQIKQETLYEYPKFSEILAEAGSIISWILSLSYFVMKYNENVSITSMKNDILNMYYSDFEKFQIKKNYFGKILQISINDKQYNQNDVIKIYKKLDQLALEKLCFRKLLQDIQRIKYLICKIIGKEEFIKQSDQSQSLDQQIQIFIQQNKILPQKQSQIIPQDELSNIGNQNLEQEHIGIFSFEQLTSLDDIDVFRIKNEENYEQIDISKYQLKPLEFI